MPTRTEILRAGLSDDVYDRLLPLLGGGNVVAKLGSETNWPVLATGVQPMVGLTFPLVAGASYVFEVVAALPATVGASSYRLGVDYSGSASNFTGLRSSMGNGSGFIGLNNTAAAQGFSLSNVLGGLYFSGMITTNSSGDLQILWASSTTAALNSMSKCVVTKV